MVDKNLPRGNKPLLNETDDLNMFLLAARFSWKRIISKGF